MTAFSIFAICILLTLIFLVIAFLLLGQGFFMIALIFPAHAADVLTRGVNLGFNSKSFLYKSIFGLFILIEVLCITLLFFGLYCLFFGYPIPENPATEISKVYSLAELTRLTYINQLLLLLEVYFLLMFTYFSIKHREQYATMQGFYYFSYRILPIISFPLAFTYLVGTLRYLLNYSSEQSIGMLPLIAGYMYATYSIYTLGKTIIMYSRTFSYSGSGLTFRYWLNLAITLVYNILFLYFFYHIHASI